MIHIYAHVTYRDINLQRYRGILRAIGHTPHGGNCTVQWTVPLPVAGEECMDNLITLCLQCLYPYDGPGCPNPACPQDKGATQLERITAAQEARKTATRYAEQHRGIDYSRSFKKEKTP